MGKTELIIFLVAALIVCVESCSNSGDCGKGYCCIDGECTEDFSLGCNSCSSDSSCANGCCVDYKCKPSSSYACNEKKRSDDYTFTYDGNSRNSSSSSNTGLVIGMVIVVFVKLVLFYMCCSRRRRRVVAVHRRVTCDVTVPIAENDELQREHERAEQETSDYPPPSYTPRAEPWEDGTQNDGQNPDQVPVPAYSPSPATISSEDTNSAQREPTQREGITGNTEESNGVTQGSIMVPLNAYSPSPAANQLKNITLQNVA